MNASAEPSYVMNTKPLFKLMVERKASDLFFSCNAPIKIKIEGKIFPVNKQVLSPETVRQAALGLMTHEQLESFNHELEIDFAIDVYKRQALNIIFSPLKGLMPSRALVAGFFTTFIFSSPGIVNTPWPRKLFLIAPESESNTAPTCFFESSVSFEIVARISDLVGAAFFFAILNLLLMFANAGR